MCIKNLNERPASTHGPASDLDGLTGNPAGQRTNQKTKTEPAGLSLKKVESAAKKRRMAKSPAYATKVKKLVQYEGGKLESILLPVLVATTTLAAPNVTADDDGNPAGLIKMEQPEYQEYEGSEADEREFYGDQETQAVRRGDNKPKKEGGKVQGKAMANAARSAAIAAAANGNAKAASCQSTKDFIRTLLHALDCKACDSNACKKMRLVLGHFLSCGKISQGQSCPLCQQLLRIVARHAEQDCVLPAGPAGRSCPVPMCDVIRAEQQAGM